MTQSAKKPITPLPLPLPARDADSQDALEQVRPKPKRYADKTFMPPAGTRRSMGKR